MIPIKSLCSPSNLFFPLPLWHIRSFQSLDLSSDFIKYIHTYVISIPRACAEDHRISRSASVCPSPISFTSTSTITETPTSVSWAALSAAYPHKDGGSVPVYIRLSFPTHPSSSHSSSDNGPTMTGTRISEETKISVGSGFHRTIKLTDLMVNSSG